MRRREHVSWFWLVYAAVFTCWCAIDLARGAGSWGDWVIIGVMAVVAVYAFVEVGQKRTTNAAWSGIATTDTRVEFAAKDFDFAMGEVHGIRAWKLDDRGRLRPLHIGVAAAWRPGINEAACHLRDVDAFSRVFGISLSGHIPGPPARDQAKHEVPVESCRCGFYAYTDLDHDENKADAKNRYVLGVIRGTGRTLIGTKGFRCEKAEIVALLDPTRAGRLLTGWRREQARQLRTVYPDVPLLSSKRELVAFRPIEQYKPEPTSDDFWAMP